MQGTVIVDWNHLTVAGQVHLSGPQQVLLSGASEIELRLLPISYALRLLGEVGAPPPQKLALEMNGVPLGENILSDLGWEVYRVLLPSGLQLGEVARLRMEISSMERPADFSRGKNNDQRLLGFALDYVRLIAEPDARMSGH